MSYKTLTNRNKKLQRERMQLQTWTKSDILAFAKMLNSMRYSDQERRSDIQELHDELVKALDNMPGGYKITEEQSQFGIDWLKKLVFTKRGEISKAKKVENFGEHEAAIIKNFLKFEFMGFYEASFNALGDAHWVPVYRTIGKDGHYFDYFCAGWKTPQIVGYGQVKTKLQSVLK